MVLAPDMAFALGRLERTASATQPLLHLGRDDLERSEGALLVADHVDWIHPPREPRDRAAITFARALIVLSAGRAGTRRSRTSARAVLHAYDMLARANVDRGRRMLSRGRVVVTERLHGHILCVLMSIPHVIVADRYGKLRAFHETWTRDAPGVRWADSLADAQRAAQELARGG